MDYTKKPPHAPSPSTTLVQRISPEPLGGRMDGLRMRVDASNDPWRLLPTHRREPHTRKTPGAGELVTLSNDTPSPVLPDSAFFHHQLRGRSREGSGQLGHKSISTHPSPHVTRCGDPPPEEGTPRRYQLTDRRRAITTTSLERRTRPSAEKPWPSSSPDVRLTVLTHSSSFLGHR